MKAIDPVIATLILIAIAVIAGVFVLRQFILLSSTAGQQNMLQVQDVTFYRTISPDGKTMNVTLQYSVKNIGQRQIILVKISIPDANKTSTINVNLNPGQVYSGTIQVLVNQNYTQAWDAGTEHIVTFYYKILGQPALQSQLQTGFVQ